MDVRHGAIVDCHWSPPGESTIDEGLSEKLKQLLKSKKIHEMRNWLSLLQGRVPYTEAQDMVTFLEKMLPAPQRQS
jgi:hypothetical protein